jgi:lysophospholipase L1-like esterase
MSAKSGGRFLATLAVAGFAAAAMSCGDANVMEPSIPGPVITCPAPVTVESPTGAAMVVNYPAPTVSEGVQPITTTCTPPSGSTFQLGTTSVTCTARDANQRTNSCGFTVTVNRTPRLSVDRFEAFGDSITAGVLATSCPFGGGVSCSVPTSVPLWLQRKYELQRMFADMEASTAAYPRVLQSMLGARYRNQTFTMANEGVPGEFVSDGKARLPGTIGSAQVLLLQEGANDMNQAHPPVDVIVEDLRAMVRQGRGRGMQVFVGTLLPQRQNACRGYDYCDGTNDTLTTNARIRTMAASEGATLVDLYPAFENQTTTLLGLDGLHPNEAGYQRMAELFFEAIRQRLEVP